MKAKRYNRMRLLRVCIQSLALIIFIYSCLEFYQYFKWVTNQEGAGAFHPRPALLEIFLPASVLAAAKNFFSGFGFDPVHPAGLSVFFAAMLISFAARKSVCGYLCPIGCLCGFLNRLGARLDKKLGSPLGLPRRPGRLISTLISLPKYILLAVLLWAVLAPSAPESTQAFLASPYNKTLDSRIWVFFTRPSQDVLIGLGVILAGSVLAPGFWCRGFCPYGALLGLFSFLSPLAVRRDKSRCTYCRRCARACQARIAVHEAVRISSPECQGCLECMAACPVEGCLKVQAGYRNKEGKIRTAPVWLIPFLCVALMAAVYFAALGSGHWHSRVTPAELKTLHQQGRASDFKSLN
jgi:NAD-dependent dihydropyrimidine dehydrogenase PreA subunit